MLRARASREEFRVSRPLVCGAIPRVFRNGRGDDGIEPALVARQSKRIDDRIFHKAFRCESAFATWSARAWKLRDDFVVDDGDIAKHR